MGNNTIDKKNGRYLTKQETHDIAIALEGINGEICSKVTNIIDENPYIGIC